MQKILRLMIFITEVRLSALLSKMAVYHPTCNVKPWNPLHRNPGKLCVGSIPVRDSANRMSFVMELYRHTFPDGKIKIDMNVSFFKK